MTRNLKLLGVCLAAVFAMSAVMASAALAQQGKLTSDGEVTLKSTETGVNQNRLTAFAGGFTECPGTVFTGHKIATTPHVLIPSGATQVTLTPIYGTCKTTLGGIENAPTTIDMNSCDFELTTGNTVASQEYAVTAGVKCNTANDHILVTVFSSAAHSLKLCTITIDAATSGIGGAKVKNTHTDPPTNSKAGDIDLSGTFTPFTATKSGLCGAGEDKEAKLDVDVTVKGFNSVGTETEITVSDNA